MCSLRFTHVRAFLSLCVSNISFQSFTSLAHWTSHTSEVTSKHASPQPGVIKSLRQWKTGEEKWLNRSFYSHWCLTHRFLTICHQKGYMKRYWCISSTIYESADYVDFIWTFLHEKSVYGLFYLHVVIYCVYFKACYFKLITSLHFQP